MRKEQKIQEAWGVLYDKYKERISLTDGYLHYKSDKVRNEVREVLGEIETSDHLYMAFRPKSLSGIENNNGWINIESEKDFPTKDNNRYWIIKNGEIKMFHWEKGETLNVAAWLYTITHYQIIENPKLPVY